MISGGDEGTSGRQWSCGHRASLDRYQVLVQRSNPSAAECEALFCKYLPL